ncbi:MAG: hypothetical protein U1A78_32175 [Polyangia bacterium]
MAVAWERKSTGETLAFFGGQWDQIERRFTGREPERCAVIRFNESQLELALWAAWWMQERREGRPRDFIGLFAIGDRGSGKTYAAVGILGTAQVEFASFGGDPSIAWIVSRTHAERAEVDRYFTGIFPDSWYVYREQGNGTRPAHTYLWVTGATLTNISADDPNTLKRGRVDFLLVNEAGLVGKKIPFNGLGRLKDKGGLGLLTANPPDNVRAQWILDLHEKAESAREKRRPYPIRFLRVMSAGNEDLDREAGDQIAQVLIDLDPRAAAADVHGLLLPIGERAYFRFRKHHLRAPPEGLRDITRLFTQLRFGAEFDYFGGVDFQGTPHHAAVVCKIFGTLADPVIWVVDEFVAEQSTEDDLLDEVLRAGYNPRPDEPYSLCWVGDASGQWQDGAHNRNGRDSFQVFRERGFRILPPAEKRGSKGAYSKNPPVEKRVGLVNKQLGGRADDKDPQSPELPVRLFIDAALQRLALALRECPWAKARYGGKPVGFYSHITDALGYVVWFVFPAPGRDLDGPVALLAPGPLHRSNDGTEE